MKFYIYNSSRFYWIHDGKGQVLLQRLSDLLNLKMYFRISIQRILNALRSLKILTTTFHFIH